MSGAHGVMRYWNVLHYHVLQTKLDWHIYR